MTFYLFHSFFVRCKYQNTLGMKHILRLKYVRIESDSDASKISLVVDCRMGRLKPSSCWCSCIQLWD